MPRRWFALLPIVTACGVVVAVLLDLGAVVAAGVGVAGGLAVALVLDRDIGARVRRGAERLKAVGTDAEEATAPSAGAGPWRELDDAIDAIGASMRARLGEVADERARALRLLEGLPPAILLFTDRLAYANLAARRLFELQPDAGAPSLPQEVLGGDATLAEVVARARQSGAETVAETDFGERTLHARAAPTAPGEIVLVVTDLTEARRVEAMRRDFVTNASHELKTPVAGLQALSESLGLALRRDPARADRMLERMQSEAGRLARLVRDLLDLARIEEAAPERHRVSVDFAAIVRQQVERVRALAGERGVTVTTDVPARVDLDGVPEDLRMIVANLVENAVRYNVDGGRVAVAVRVDDQTATLCVDDTGIGIPEADRQRVFERFYRVDKGRSREAGGTGLGLSLVRHAVLRHSGSVSLDSELGAGTTVRVTLPTSEAASEA